MESISSSLKPTVDKACAEMLEELGISILQLRHSDLGGLSLSGHKQMGSGKMILILYEWSFAGRVYTRASLVQSKQIMTKCHWFLGKIDSHFQAKLVKDLFCHVECTPMEEWKTIAVKSLHQSLHKSIQLN